MHSNWMQVVFSNCCFIGFGSNYFLEVWHIQSTTNRIAKIHDFKAFSPKDRVVQSWSNWVKRECLSSELSAFFLPAKGSKISRRTWKKQRCKFIHINIYMQFSSIQYNQIKSNKSQWWPNVFMKIQSIMLWKFRNYTFGICSKETSQSVLFSPQLLICSSTV